MLEAKTMFCNAFGIIYRLQSIYFKYADSVIGIEHKYQVLNRKCKQIKNYL